MKLLVLQHIAVEHPGVWRDFMRAGGVTWEAVELDAGEAIPPLDGYDALISMGGPMDVFDEAEHPWLAAEKAIIREAVAKRAMPFLGVCLGHQLLGEALGGRVTVMAEPEVGLMEVSLTPAGRADALFDGVGETLACLQWHGCEIGEMPAGGEILAASAGCPVQAIRAGRHAYGLQFHVEMTARTVAEWAAIPAYAQSLESALGDGAVARLDADIAANLAAFNATARRIYENFISLIG
ncbi:MAG TPA: type 1 glutamine amidotransferase [Alphaproteobacteria bacterium]|nr:type 1 glutamine amidotransferase [Alphaproteobacteria bacterium]